MSIVSVAFDTGARRNLTGFAAHAVKGFAAASAAWAIWAAALSRSDALSLTITFLTLMLVLTFLVITPSVNAAPDVLHRTDILLALVSLGVGVFFMAHAEAITERITLLDPLSSADVVCASLLILLTIEALRRTVGVGLTVLVLLFMAYNLFGDQIPGPLQHGEISAVHFLDIMIFTTDGLFGVPLRVAATYAFLFVMFGTMLSKTGGADFFFNLAAAISGRSPGGPAKIAVVSSGLYGTISGSPTSDVVTTGAVTIPMMRRLGYSPAFAGAVEVAASTGGSLLPPVMGAAAFIMAEYTGIAYVTIAMGALIPAVLYYLSIYFLVHLRAQREQLSMLDSAGQSGLFRTLAQGWLFILPLVAITWALLDGYTPTYAAIYGLATVLVVSLFRRSSRLSFAQLVDVLAETSLRMVSVAGACAAAGLVIGGITMTGLASKLGHLVFIVAGESQFVSLLVAALITIVLGMGMPTPSAYILAAVLIGPVMTSLGIDTLAGHLFLLYYAVMSALTPPVAVAAYAASAIAAESPIKIAVSAVRIALPAFLVPFAFVYSPGLILQGSLMEIVQAVVFIGLGLALLIIGMEGYLSRPLTARQRILVAVAGLLMFFGSWKFGFAAIALLALARLISPRTR